MMYYILAPRTLWGEVCRTSYVITENPPPLHESLEIIHQGFYPSASHAGLTFLGTVTWTAEKVEFHGHDGLVDMWVTWKENS